MKGFKSTSEHFGSQYAAGGRIGFYGGGKVYKDRNTSSEFVQTKGKQDSMDSGVQPKRKGRNQAEIEAGGVKKLKPKYAKGGKTKKIRKLSRHESRMRKAGAYKEGGKV